MTATTPSQALRTPVRLAEPHTTLGAKPCVLQFDPNNELVSLDSAGGQTRYFLAPLHEIRQACDIKKRTPQINIALDSKKYTLLFETQGQSIKRGFLDNLWQLGWFGKAAYNTPGFVAFQQWAELLK